MVIRRQTGFTLIEIAIVLLIVIVLLGYSVAMFPMQQELKQYRAAEAQMDTIIEELIAFAQVNGRLPCPDTSGNVNATGAGTLDGQEDTDTEASGDISCKSFYGFLPARSLGMNGKYNSTGQLVDPWGAPFRYAISNTDTGDGDIDLVTANNIRDEGMTNVTPDLTLCDDSTTIGNQLTCVDAGGSNVITQVAAIVVSLGKSNLAANASNIETENLDNLHVGTTDKLFISSVRREDYDDVVRWVSTNLLFSRMIAADQLP